MSLPNKRPKPGEVYKHFKGNLYIVLCLGEHTETREEMVVYHSTTEERIWIRPLKEWNSPAFISGRKTTRFKLEVNPYPKAKTS